MAPMLIPHQNAALMRSLAVLSKGIVRVPIPDASPTIFVEMTIATEHPAMQDLVWIKSLIAAYPKPVYSFEHEKKKLWGLQFWLCINIWFQVPVPCNIMIQKRAFRHAKMQMHTQWLRTLVNIMVLYDTSIWLPKLYSWIFFRRNLFLRMCLSWEPGKCLPD